MANTPNLALPYPVPADTADVPRDVKALADKLDVVVNPAGVPVHIVGSAGEPTFGNLWTNYGAPYTTLRFWKDLFGTVFFDGVVKNSSPAATGAVIQIPSGFRPGATSMFNLWAGAGVTQVEIGANGLIIPVRYAAGGTADWVSYGGVSYRQGA